jgi:excisionase family DNA binding protein
MHAQGTALPAGQGRSVRELSDLDSPYTVAEVARFLRKHVNTVYGWIADGTLQAEKIGGTYYVPRWVLAPLVSSAGGPSTQATLPEGGAGA